MPQLMQYLEHAQPIYAAEGAISQFQLLLSQFGGPKEHMRWQLWKERIESVSSSNQSNSSARIEALESSSSMTEASHLTLS